ncbi:MAG: ATP-binding protein [Candidatus Aenigmatarchaeota archaeon]
MSEEIIGRCIGEAKINEVEFLSTKLPEVGKYVILEYDNKKVLGMIESLTRFHPALLEDVYNEEEIDSIKNFEEDMQIIKGKIKILGEVDTLKLPKIPPAPGTIVKVADKETLEKIFGKSEKSISIGKLLSNEDVEVYIDVNKLVSRHLAILSITGAGKSNTVSVLSEGISKLGGTVLIFDMHSEYVDAEFSKKKILDTKINPLFLHPKEAARLINIEENAYIQYMFFRKVFEKVKNEILKQNIKLDTDIFFETMIKELEREAKKETSSSESIYKVIMKLEDFREKFGEILDLRYDEITNIIEKGKINIADLGSVDEEVADVFVSHTLRKLLEERKRYKSIGKGLSFPVFVVIEEAHILIPKDFDTFSKYWASRIAREGRKFGIGLCLVSQRPKALDANVLSQANNMIILKLIEPNDQKYVQAASEMLTDELLVQLSSLNVGEAIVFGPMIRIPAIVKIHEFKGKISGKDIDFIEESRKEENSSEDLI